MFKLGSAQRLKLDTRAVWVERGRALAGHAIAVLAKFEP